MTDNSRKNIPETFIDKHGILWTISHGRATVANLDERSKESTRLAQKILAEGNPLLVLSDQRQSSKHDAEVRGEGLKRVDEFPLEKLAVLYRKDDLYAMKIFDIIIERSSKKDRIKRFTDEAVAVAWLLEEQPKTSP